jgi:uncharacterized membrane protein
MPADANQDRLRAALDDLVTRISELEALDAAADALQKVVEKALAATGGAPLLRGAWLGHPLHPALTDLPIGFWTSAWVLDFGGRRTRGAADAMVAAGLLSVAPTVAAGLADWTERDRVERRLGLVHMGANGLATLLYAASLAARRRDQRIRGIALSWAGAAAATAGAYLGGHLSFGSTDETPSQADAADIVDPQGEVLAAIAH